MYQELIDKLLNRFGSYRKVAVATELDKATIWRLHNGILINPTMRTHNKLVETLNKTSRDKHDKRNTHISG